MKDYNRSISLHLLLRLWMLLGWGLDRDDAQHSALLLYVCLKDDKPPEDVPIFLEPSVEDEVPVPKALLGKACSHSLE